MLGSPFQTKFCIDIVKLREILSEKGMNSLSFSKKSKISYRTLSGRAKNKSIAIKTLMKICETLDILPLQIASEEESRVIKEKLNCLEDELDLQRIYYLDKVATINKSLEWVKEVK